MRLTDEDRDWISKQLERVENNLAAGFHKWALPEEARLPNELDAGPPSGSPS